MDYPFYQNDYQNLTLICDKQGMCYGLGVRCPRYAYCNILCLAPSACSELDVEWPALPGMGSLICNSTNYPCDIANYPIPKSGVPYSLDCNLNADAEACKGADIHCPFDAACDIYCNDDRSCEYVCDLYVYKYSHGY